MSNEVITNSKKLEDLIDKIITADRSNTVPVLQLSGEEKFSKFNKSNNVPSYFITLLRNCVLESQLNPNVVSTLEKCQTKIKNQLFSEGLRETLKQYKGQVPVNRLEQNIQALISSTQTAIAALSGNQPATEAYAKELLTLLPVTQTTSTARVKPLLSSDSWINSLPQTPEQILLKEVFSQLSADGHQVMPAYYWVEYFLQKEETLRLRHRQVPVLAYVSSPSKLKSFLAYLVFYLIESKESNLIEHPSTCLLPLGEELLQGIKRAWTSVKSSEQSVVWQFKTQAIAQNGDSLSAAASCAIYSLYQDTLFDDKKVVLGVICSTPDPKQPYFTNSEGQQHTNYQVEPVACEADKLEHAKECGLNEAVLAEILDSQLKAFDRDYLCLNNLQKDGLKIHYINNLLSIVELTQKAPLRLGIPYIPDKPNHFFIRHKEFNELKTLLLSKETRSVALTSSSVIGLHGIGGIGKTTLALTLIVHQDWDLWRAFPDGIIWINLGSELNINEITSRQDFLLYELTKLATNNPNENIQRHLDRLSKTHSASNTEFYKGLLKQYFANKRCLLILDDVWEQEQLAAFDVLNNNASRMIITTRITKLAKAKSVNSKQEAIEFALPNLEKQQAVELLSSWVGYSNLPQAAYTLLDKIKYHPQAILLLSLAARDKLRPNKWRWDKLLTELQKGNWDKLNQDQQLEELFLRSTKLLKPELAEMYYQLAVFHSDTAIPVTVVVLLLTSTKLSSSSDNIEKQVDKIEQQIGELANFGLLKTVLSDETPKIEIHDLLYSYLQLHTPNRQGLHGQLISAYQKQAKQGWHTVEDDGYFYQYFAYHLKQAGQTNELKNLLLNYYWLERKIAVTDINGLLSDYAFAEQDDDVYLLERTLQVSSHILRQHKHQLASQLLARLNTSSPALQRLLTQASQPNGYPWIKPLSASFISGESPLRFTLQGHTASVNSVAVYQQNGRLFAISTSDDASLKIWDLHSKLLVATLNSHSARVRAVTIYQQNNKLFAISISNDFTLKIWDLHSNSLISTLAGHSDSVADVAVYHQHDKLFAISTSTDKTLKVWDLHSNSLISTLAGHSDSVGTVTVHQQNNKLLAISASTDETLKVWDLHNYSLISTLTNVNYQRSNKSLAVYQQNDKLFVIFSSDDLKLKIWDLHNNSLISTLAGHSEDEIFWGTFGRPIVEVEIYQHDNKIFTISCCQDKIKIWDLSSYSLGTSLETNGGDWLRLVKVCTHNNKPFAIFTHNGLYGGPTKIWDLSSYSSVGTFEGHSDYVHAVEIYLQDNKSFAISTSRDTTLKIWDLSPSSIPVTTAKHSSFVNLVEIYQQDNKFFAISVSYDGTLKIWDSSHFSLVATLEHGIHDEPGSVKVYQQDGKSFAISSGYEDVNIWDLSSFSIITTLYKLYDHNCNLQLYKQDSKFFVIYTYTVSDHTYRRSETDRGLCMYDLSSCLLKATFARFSHPKKIKVIKVYQQDNKPFVIVSSDDNTLEIWDLSSLSLVATLKSSNVNMVEVYKQNNKTFAIFASEKDTTLKIWDLSSYSLVTTLEGHSDSVSIVKVYKQNNKFFAISVSKNNIKLWDLDSKKEMGFFTNHSQPIQSVVLHKHEKVVIQM